MNFVVNQLNDCNERVKSYILPLLEQMKDVIIKYLPDFYENLDLSNCLYWQITINADVDIDDQGFKSWKVKDVLKQRGQFYVFYKDRAIFEIHVEIAGDNIRVTNKYDIIFNLEDKICTDHNTPKYICGCGKTASDHGVDFLFHNLSDFSNLHMNFTSLFGEESDIVLPVNKGTAPKEATPTVSKDDIAKIAEGLKRQLGINKQKVMAVAATIMKRNPDIVYDDLVTALIRQAT